MERHFALDGISITFVCSISSVVKLESESQHKSLGFMRLKGENILIEMCFITNANDMASYQANKVQLAESLADVLIKYAK